MPYIAPELRPRTSVESLRGAADRNRHHARELQVDLDRLEATDTGDMPARAANRICSQRKRLKHRIFELHYAADACARRADEMEADAQRREAREAAE